MAPPVQERMGRLLKLLLWDMMISPLRVRSLSSPMYALRPSGCTCKAPHIHAVGRGMHGCARCSWNTDNGMIEHRAGCPFADTLQG